MHSRQISILCDQSIANITLLKPLSFTFSVLSIVQLTTGLPPYFSFSTLALPLMPMTMQFFSIVSLLVLVSWVLLTTGSSLISRTCHFQSLLTPLPLPSYRHLVVFPRLCLGSYSFHNLCLTNCSNYILSRCQSTAIC